MSQPFVAQLRARGDTIDLVRTPGAPRITVRVEMPEVWDTVKIDVSPSEIVSVVVSAALEQLDPAAHARDLVLKLRGFEVLNEQQSLAEVGARDGSCFLLTSRRRRPVR